MEMAALIISPLPKLAAPTKAPESAQVSGGAEGSESASGETTSDLDEDALYEASKRSKIQQVKSKQTAKKVTLATHKKAHKDDSEQGFLRSSDLLVSSGDASSGSSSWSWRIKTLQKKLSLWVVTRNVAWHLSETPVRYLILKNYFLSHENNSGGIQQREDYDLRGFYDVPEKMQVSNDNMNLE